MEIRTFMKAWTLASLGVIAGLIIGVLVSFLIFRYLSAEMFETEYQIQCRDRVNILRQLKAGNAQELAATLEQRLPQWAAGVPTVVRNKQRVQMILWDVQRYYEENGVTIPANLRPVLDSQPPRPLTSGELKKKNGE